MGNKLPSRWNYRWDKIIYQCEYFTLVETGAKKWIGGYYNSTYGIRITQKGYPQKEMVYAHEYVHMTEKHKGHNVPENEYLAHRVSALLAKHYGWSGLDIALRGINRWGRDLDDNKMSQLKLRAKKLAQSFLTDTYFQEGINLLESME